MVCDSCLYITSASHAFAAVKLHVHVLHPDLQGRFGLLFIKRPTTEEFLPTRHDNLLWPSWWQIDVPQWVVLWKRITIHGWVSYNLLMAISYGVGSFHSLISAHQEVALAQASHPVTSSPPVGEHFYEPKLPTVGDYILWEVKLCRCLLSSTELRSSF